MTSLLRDVSGELGCQWPEPARLNATDVLPSRLAVSELAMDAVACAALAAGELSRARGGPRPGVTVDGRAISAAFRSDRLVRIDGQPIRSFAELSRFWPARDGWVRTHGNYPHHRQRLLAALGLAPDATAGDVAGTIAQRPAVETQAAVVAAGGICAEVRTPQQWKEHPQAAAVQELALLSITPIGDAPRRQLPPPPRGRLLPAAGLRVLDFTRVIAGPTATATLALLGADVLRIDAPHLPELPDMHVITGMGKRSALLDVSRDRALLEQLVASADVVVTGYRPGALDRHGLSPGALAAMRPGIVVASLSAWGGTGPWGARRGFDSIVQAASGIAMTESPDGATPGALPAQALDYATGFLLAAGILTAVERQLTDGASFHVQAHLARTAAWLLDHPDLEQRALPEVEDFLGERRSPLGLVRYPLPPVQFDDAPTDWAPITAWGTSPREWLPR